MSPAALGPHRLPSADAAWLNMDRPTNLMVVNSLLLFDEPLDCDRLRGVIQSRLVTPYPRFAQRVVENRIRPDRPAWEDYPRFEIEQHLHHRGLPEPGDEQVLQELVSDLIAMPLDRAKPLWDIYVIDRAHQGSAVLVRMHHCIADGIALARVMLQMTDAAVEPSEGVVFQSNGGSGEVDHRSRLPGPAAAALGATHALASMLVHESAEALVHPRHLMDLTQAIGCGTTSLMRLLTLPADPESALRGQLGPRRRVAWLSGLQLSDVKAIAHAQSATVNDVLLAAVSGALRRYVMAHGEEPQEFRAIIPFNLRAPDEPIPRELGNRFGTVFVTLPVDIGDRRRRLQEVKRRMDDIKGSPDGAVTYAVLGVMGLVPAAVESRLVDSFSSKATAVMTNVPGPREPVFLAGARVRSVMVWAPPSGSVGMSVSIFSYCDEVSIGLLVDANLVRDPELIVHHLKLEVAALGRLHHA